MSEAADRARVGELLGREPQAQFVVVVRHPSGDPVVIRNAAFLDDGTPMPTHYWLVDPGLLRAISRIEADGGVKAAQAEVDVAELEAAHARYAADRDESIRPGYLGPRPSGGIGGTRQGVKCLHAHYAYLLAGGSDPVGDWVQRHLETEGSTA